MPNNPELERMWKLVKEARADADRFPKDTHTCRLAGFARQRWVNRVREIYGKDITLEWKNGEYHLSNGEIYK